MACRVSGGSTILLCLGLFLVACCHCRRTTKLKALDKVRGNLMPNHGQAKGNELRHGRLLIGQNDAHGAKPKGIKADGNLMDVDTDYQADMGWGQLKQREEHGDDHDAAVARILKMEPKVECTGDSMTLQVQDAALTPGTLFFVDRGSRLSPLPLSRLPQSCGYSIRATQSNLVLAVPYDGCFVGREEDSYVLPLRCLGLPVRMSCPLTRQSHQSNPPMVTCHAEGMVVKMEWTMSASEIKVNLNGNWEPLMKSSSRCGFGVVEHPEGLVISVHYEPCLEIKDGMYTLLLAGHGQTKISCPSVSPVQPEPTKNPANDSKPQTEPPSKREHPFTPSLNSTTTVVPEPPPKSPEQTAPEVPNEVIYDPKPTLTALPTSLPVTQTSVTKPPPGQLEQLPNPQTSPSQPPQETVKQTESQLEVQDYKPHYPMLYPWLPPAYQAPYANSYPRYPEKLPEQPLPPKPTASEVPRGQIFQPFYPYVWSGGPYEIPLPPTDETPTTATKGEVEQPLSPLEPESSEPKAPENLSPSEPSPTPEVKESPQPETPQGPVYQPFYPNPFYPWLDPEKGPYEKPAAVPEPPQPEAPEGQVYQPFYPNPFYPWLDPEKGPYEKPAAVPEPPQPEAPEGQVYQPFYPNPFYPWLEPEKRPYEKPAAVPEPPQPETPQGPVYQPFYPNPFYPWLDPQKGPYEKPAAVPEPPQPEAPEGQVYQPFYPNPFYPWLEPEKRPYEKPAAVPEPPQPEAPEGQVYQPFYPNPFYPWLEPEKQPYEKPAAVPEPPQPEKQPDEKPIAVPEPPQPEKPTAVPEPPQPEKQPDEKPIAVPEPTQAEKPTAVPKPPQPEASQGQVYQPFYPYFFYQQPQPDEKPIAVPKPPQPEKQPDEKPIGVPKPPQPEKPTAVPKPPQPEKQPDEKPTAVPTSSWPGAPQGPEHQPFHPQPNQPRPEMFYPFYLNPFHPNPLYPQPNQPGESSTNAPPEAPQGTVYQPLYTSHLKPQPQPENQPIEKPTAVSRPTPTETPMVRKPFPQPSLIPGTETNGEDPTEKPVHSEQPPAVEPPAGHVPHPFYPYYYYHLLQPQAVTLPPATTTQQPQQVTTPASIQTSTESVIPQPSNGGKQPQDLQPGSSFGHLCPSFCPSGFSNCCPQIAFHQHLHHIVPAGPGSKEASQFYTGLPFLPPLNYAGFGDGFGSPPLPQKPTEAAKTSTSAPVSHRSLESRHEKLHDLQPPGGNTAARPVSNSNKPANPEQMYPYFVADPLYPNRPYQPRDEEQLQNLPQWWQSPAHSMASKTHVPEIPLMPYKVQLPQKQQNGTSTGYMRNPSGLDFMPFVNPNLLQQYIAERGYQLTVQEPQQSNPESRSRETKRLDHPLVPYFMHKDIQAHAPDNPAVPNDSTPQSVSGSKKPVGHEQTPNTQPKGFVLLQHGPPDRKPDPSRPLVHDSVLPQNLAKFEGSEQQPLQEPPQHHKWLRKGISNPMTDDGSHFMPSPQDPSLSAPHLKPRFFNSFKQFRKPMTPPGSNQRILPHVPQEAFRRWSSAADHQANGPSPRIQRSGNRKQN